VQAVLETFPADAVKASSGGRAFEMILQIPRVSKILWGPTALFSASLGSCARCTRTARLLALLVWSVTLLAALQGRTAAVVWLGLLATGLTILYVAHFVGEKYRGTVYLLLLGCGATRADAGTMTAALDLVLARHGRDCRRMAEGEALHVQFDGSTGRRRRPMRVSIVDERGCVAAVSLEDDGSCVEWKALN
jgi:hypothetical protein